MRIADLCCGAGGAAMGLHQAFPDAEIVGVDIRFQKHYPFTFVEASALAFPLSGFDFIWASPPCQAYTPLKATSNKTYPDLVAVIRHRLTYAYTPWIIENVPQAPIRKDAELCGAMFGLRVYRHRWFESNLPLLSPSHPKHVVRSTGTQRGRKAHYEAGGFITITGDVGTYCGDAMGIDWMTGNELSQAIPPAYSRYLAQFIPLSAAEAA
jgi:DNA (cytosine-5)-methyltransferase 1